MARLATSTWPDHCLAEPAQAYPNLLRHTQLKVQRMSRLATSTRRTTACPKFSPGRTLWCAVLAGLTPRRAGDPAGGAHRVVPHPEVSQVWLGLHLSLPSSKPWPSRSTWPGSLRRQPPHGQNPAPRGVADAVGLEERRAEDAGGAGRLEEWRQLRGQDAHHL